MAQVVPLGLPDRSENRMQLHRSNSSAFASASQNFVSLKQPQYWDWSKYAAAPQNSPLFNGDDYSMGGNGAPVAHAANSFSFTPAGLGGGCVTKGPFKNMSVNLGPIGMQPVGPSQGLGYNPRCLKRDIGPTVSTQNTNYTSVLGKY